MLLTDGRVLWIDFEDDERGVVGRLKALGVPDDVILARFGYINPDEPLGDGVKRIARSRVDLAEALGEPWDLVVIDGVTESMALEGFNLNDNTDAADWQRRLPKYAARTTGAPVACIDHVTKSSENRGRWAIGAQHKLAGTSGVTFAVHRAPRCSWRPASR